MRSGDQVERDMLVPLVPLDADRELVREVAYGAPRTEAERQARELVQLDLTLELSPDAGGEGRFAVIDSERALDVDGTTQVLLSRSKQQRESAALRWSTKIDDRTKYRETARNATQRLAERRPRDDVDMLAALASDLFDDGGALRSTAFDLTSGNQRILQSIRVFAGEPEMAKGKPDPLTRDAVEEALIGPWKYRDAHHSLGWDPHAQRLHALRGKLPEKDKENRSVRAAVFLASQALPLFPCFAVGRRLRTTAFHRYDGDEWFAWPVWSEPISLDTLRSLLAQPFTNDLRQRGVDTVYRCRRSHTGGSEGNYQVFSHPEERPGQFPVRRDPHDRPPSEGGD
jgi:hypothetical protein